MESFLILPFGNELPAVRECGKRTLALKFPLQPALRQCPAQLSQIRVSIAGGCGATRGAGRRALGGGHRSSAIGKRQKQHCEQWQSRSKDEQNISAARLNQIKHLALS